MDKSGNFVSVTALQHLFCPLRFLRENNRGSILEITENLKQFSPGRIKLDERNSLIDGYPTTLQKRKTPFALIRDELKRLPTKNEIIQLHKENRLNSASWSEL